MPARGRHRPVGHRHRAANGFDVEVAARRDVRVLRHVLRRDRRRAAARRQPRVQNDVAIRGQDQRVRSRRDRLGGRQCACGLDLCHARVGRKPRQIRVRHARDPAIEACAVDPDVPHPADRHGVQGLQVQIHDRGRLDVPDRQIDCREVGVALGPRAGPDRAARLKPRARRCDVRHLVRVRIRDVPARDDAHRIVRRQAAERHVTAGRQPDVRAADARAGRLRQIAARGLNRDIAARRNIRMDFQCAGGHERGQPSGRQHRLLRQSAVLCQEQHIAIHRRHGLVHGQIARPVHDLQVFPRFRAGERRARKRRGRTVEHHAVDVDRIDRSDGQSPRVPHMNAAVRPGAGSERGDRRVQRQRVVVALRAAGAADRAAGHELRRCRRHVRPRIARIGDGSRCRLDPDVRAVEPGDRRMLRGEIPDVAIRRGRRAVRHDDRAVLRLNIDRRACRQIARRTLQNTVGRKQRHVAVRADSRLDADVRARALRRQQDIAPRRRDRLRDGDRALERFNFSVRSRRNPRHAVDGTDRQSICLVQPNVSVRGPGRQRSGLDIQRCAVPPDVANRVQQQIIRNDVDGTGTVLNRKAFRVV